MQEFVIRLHSVRDVQEFVSAATSQPYPVMVSDGNYTAKGESFMEMFCLALAGPLTIQADCDAEALKPLLEAAERFLLK